MKNCDCCITYNAPDLMDGGVTAARIEEEATEQPRTLTPDAITDEMVLRFMNTYDRLIDGSKDAPSLNHFTVARTSLTRSALTAALTEPPARPEGAEEIEAWLDGMPESIRLDGDEHQRLFANHLAHMGFRVPVTLAEVGLTEKNGDTA